MNAQPFWELFLDTGAPEMYLLYQKVRKGEENSACNSQGLSASGNCI